MDVDASQKDSRPCKDKSDITYFNYGKKGYFKRDCRSPKKDGWRPTLGKEAATIDKRIKTIEVSAYDTYDQDDLEADIEYESYCVGDDSEGSDDVPASWD